MDNNSFINVCILRETETSTLPVAVGRTKPKEENHRPLIYQTLLLYQRVHLQDELVVLLEGLLLVVGVLLLFVQLLAHVLDQLLHGGPLKEEAVATAAAVVRHCCLVMYDVMSRWY
ncbi:uncharacterized protein LOC115987526 isoform X2 [Quercus lobata]|uniref:uncharacterized protein LOC115987526 isoform X2 n=1 Tax=Quercus lobata TaxID=97700 RepID=UPI001245FC5D|nr:uncharacterized protein LOC115987526 isoform X2 [Quercus lobata]XP_030966963.1 uncharacterized protein LOC115987526 isoform X2 [Quercus lobata]